jgi:hypothetical protein
MNRAFSLALLAVLILPLGACRRAAAQPEPESRLLRPIPQVQPTPESHETGMILSVGDARWTLVSIHGDHDPSRGRPVMVTLDVTNLSGRAAPMVVVPVARDDQGSPYVAQHETDASNPVASQPRLADAALAPGQTRRVRFLFLLPRRRTVSELVLPGLAPTHGARTLRVVGLPTTAPALQRWPEPSGDSSHHRHRSYDGDSNQGQDDGASTSADEGASDE